MSRRATLIRSWQPSSASREILVYSPTGGTFTVDLSQSSGRTMNYDGSIQAGIRER